MQRQALARDACVDSKSAQKMAGLLQLYRAALALHAACAGIQPQVAPLPGQAIFLGARSPYDALICRMRHPLHTLAHCSCSPLLRFTGCLPCAEAMCAEVYAIVLRACQAACSMQHCAGSHSQITCQAIASVQHLNRTMRVSKELIALQRCFLQGSRGLYAAHSCAGQ